MPDQKTLAQMIRDKYPGAYDDLSDPDLESKVLGKYPQYGDIPRTQVKQASGIPGAPNGLPPVPAPKDVVNMQPNFTSSQLTGSDPNMQLRSMQPGLPAAGQDPRVAAAGLAASSIPGIMEGAVAPTAATGSLGVTDQLGREIMLEIEGAGPSRLKQITNAISEAKEAHPAVAKIIKWGLLGLGAKYTGLLKAIGE